MRRLPDWCFLHLRAAVLLVLQERGSSGSSSHSLRVLYTLVSLPIEDMPKFFVVGFLDDQLIGHYDSNRRLCLPEMAWLKIEGHGDFWDWITWRIQDSEKRFWRDLATLQECYNQSRGLHTWQRLFGCEVSEDGRKTGYYRYAYDGRDFISLDTESVTWTEADIGAQVIKSKWEAEPLINQNRKHFMEEECIELLQEFWDYGKEALSKRESPIVKVTRKMDNASLEILTCRVHGFYPREIDAMWLKDREVWEHETLHGGVVPNSDGTYYTWLSTEVDPKERDCYQCHVEHDALQEPLTMAWEGPESGFQMRPLGTKWVAIVAAILLGAGIFLIYITSSEMEAKRIDDLLLTVPPESHCQPWTPRLILPLA
ncbi:major histocompatibility complex class I-related gene protein-like isoform X2 [Hemicordylus capensis]|uniref:major histocompatibility complex class I-related gene protein-like isoform X2 n=1 Tax=Hemicordylus capensis TaxID=884348 RepID=UPI0023037146|nr:major histocompatibility complex class I-related gene protein-like isoform X2 [Hemicordylus capensis]